jgi:DNA-binding helix-hairpin-helix protein with protein kinase domain
MVIKRVYEVDRLACPCCGGEMKIISFIERSERDVTEQIFVHCRLWKVRSVLWPATAPCVANIYGALTG